MQSLSFKSGIPANFGIIDLTDIRNILLLSKMVISRIKSLTLATNVVILTVHWTKDKASRFGAIGFWLAGTTG